MLTVSAPGTPKQRRLAWLVFVVYIAILLKVVLFKNPHVVQIMFGSIDALPLGVRVQYSNFTPFITIVYYLGGNPSTGTALRNLAGNILIFLPMGFLLPTILPTLHTIRHTAIISFVVSLALEVIQLLTGLGSFDVDDLLLNVMGATVGWLTYRGVRRVLMRLLPADG